MKKETGIAIGLGIGFGLFFSLIVILNTQKNTSVVQKQQSNQSKSVTQKEVIDSIPLSLDSPSDKLVVSTKTVEVKGKMEKNSLIVIQTPIKDITFVSVKDSFSTNVPLSLGENVIHITAYPKNQGKPQEKELRVYAKEE